MTCWICEVCSRLCLTSNMNECCNDDEGYDIPHPLHNSENRERTFTSWSNPYINIESLAYAGFIYVGPGDKVKCVFCYLIIDKWLPGEVPFKKHLNLKPDCPHIEYLQEKNENQQEINLGIITPTTPAQPDYQHLDARKKTFENWPCNHPLSPNDLAMAGFFYTKQGDKVQCFYCNLSVEKWEPNDDAYVEHCRFNSNCPFMLMQKGKEFIQQCNPGAAATEPSIETSNPVQSSRQEEIMKETLSFQGFNKIYIDCAFLQQKIRKDVPFVNSESLFNAIMELPGAEEASSARLKEPHKTNPAEIAFLKTCKVCLQRQCEYMCLPCKHFTCCKKCKDVFHNCPICELPIIFQSADMYKIIEEFLNLSL